MKGKQKLGVTFNFDKLGGIDFTKFSKLQKLKKISENEWIASKKYQNLWTEAISGPFLEIGITKKLCFSKFFLTIKFPLAY